MPDELIITIDNTCDKSSPGQDKIKAEQIKYSKRNTNMIILR